ncbi:MAG TPA: CDP-alcohol phosphatidyltransferase family protein [Coleofasciculaceae cyanobacterium]|jgi:CDP-diacylglycerol--glycerol-3-phosphate 3-phosphatidyltransferase
MASIYELKPTFQRLLKPLLVLLAGLKISPNQITLSALFLSLCGGILIGNAAFQPELLLAMPLILFIRMALNALDGMLAREYQQSTPLGEILNEVGDIVSDAVLYLPLMFLYPESMIIVFQIGLLALLASLSEFSGVLTKTMTGLRRYDGPMGKSDRAFAISFFCLAQYFLPALSHALIIPFLAMLNGLLILSCCNRLKPALKGESYGKTA